ncbi:hypothetical protein RRG08_054172 [Elysia crispata]|uniref:Uncharacterized protein n=1 Tax=Elysia crispata TaxID=231223 RepID=A0AAE1A1Z6_9GAST|nr:hypothetical protein RRG08_054172 [Elysia crispata]
MGPGSSLESESVNVSDHEGQGWVRSRILAVGGRGGLEPRAPGSCCCLEKSVTVYLNHPRVITVSFDWDWKVSGLFRRETSKNARLSPPCHRLTLSCGGDLSLLDMHAMGKMWVVHPALNVMRIEIL